MPYGLGSVDRIPVSRCCMFSREILVIWSNKNNNGCYFDVFGFQVAKHRGCREMIEEFLLRIHFREGILVADGDLQGERNGRIFRGAERIPNDVWSVVRFYVSLLSVDVKGFLG